MTKEERRDYMKLRALDEAWREERKVLRSTSASKIRRNLAKRAKELAKNIPKQDSQKGWSKDFWTNTKEENS